MTIPFGSFLWLAILCFSAWGIDSLYVINNMDDFWLMYEKANNGEFSFDVDLQCDLNFSQQPRRMEHPFGQKHRSSA